MTDRGKALLLTRWAPILLIVARVFQGLSTGGEFVGAMTYLVEQSPDRKRGMLVGFLPLGNLIGFVVAGFGSGELATVRADSGIVVWTDSLATARPGGTVAEIRQEGGQAEFDWRSEGLICRLSVPLMQDVAPRPINGRQNQAVSGNGAELASRSAEA